MGTDMSYWSNQLAAIDAEELKKQKRRERAVKERMRAIGRQKKPRKPRKPRTKLIASQGEVEIISRAWACMNHSDFCAGSKVSRKTVWAILKMYPVSNWSIDKAVAFAKTVEIK